MPVDGWIEADRAIKEPAELERIAAACGVADRALEALLPEIRPGITERELALRLEWLIRTGGADGLAFDVACLAGPEAALPHGSPGDRAVAAGEVLLFDFGAQVQGYRSDMTRTLFVGEPSARDRSLFELVAAAQAASIAARRRRGPDRRTAPQRAGRRRRGAGGHRGRRSRRALRARHRARHRSGHPRAAQPRPARDRRPAPEPDGLQRRAGGLPRRRDGGPDRGPRRGRRRGRELRDRSPGSRAGSSSSGPEVVSRAAPPRRTRRWPS